MPSIAANLAEVNTRSNKSRSQVDDVSAIAGHVCASIESLEEFRVCPKQ
jgi:hypothetical protein